MILDIKKGSEMKDEQIEEIWKPIQGYKNLYEISSFGRICSLPKTFNNGISNSNSVKKQNRKKNQKPKIRKLKLGKGKLSIDLVVDHVSGRVTYTVASLVLNAFKGPCSLENYCAVHLDGNFLNNRIENLVWGTPALMGKLRKERNLIVKMGKIVKKGT